MQQRIRYSLLATLTCLVFIFTACGTSPTDNEDKIATSVAMTIEARESSITPTSLPSATPTSTAALTPATPVATLVRPPTSALATGNEAACMKASLVDRSEEHT